MRTERRQELRTNELSAQLDQIWETVREKAALITTVVVVVVVSVGGGFWYVRGQRTQVALAWQHLNPDSAISSPIGQIDRYRSVANENLAPGLTTAAWLRIGDTALAQIVQPAKPQSGPSTFDPAQVDRPGDEEQDWSAIAREAFSKVLGTASNDPTAVGKAMITLGVLAENDGQPEKARQWYQKVMDDPRFVESPFRDQAAYRLWGLDTWSKPVTFAPPRPEVLLPESPQPTTSEAALSLPEQPDTTRERAAPAATQPAVSDNRAN